MSVVELAKEYQQRGWFKGMTSKEIENEIAVLNTEIKRADKRTYNGKATRAFNHSKIVIAKIILEAQAEEMMAS